MNIHLLNCMTLYYTVTAMYHKIKCINYEHRNAILFIHQSE